MKNNDRAATQNVFVNIITEKNIDWKIADTKKTFFLPYRSESLGTNVSVITQPAKTMEPRRPI